MTSSPNDDRIPCSILGCCGISISMNNNIQAVLGPSFTQINCSYEGKNGDVVSQIRLKARRDGQFTTVATFSPANIGILPTFTVNGTYLIGRATLTNPTNDTHVAVMTFNEILCEDETDYQCEIDYKDGITLTSPEPLPYATTNITVRVSAEKPNSAPVMSVMAGTIQEGQNVTFTCSGNVGYPAGKFVWEKLRRVGFDSTVYPDEETIVSDNRDNCTYNGTSSLTITMVVLDDLCLIRCEIQQMFVSGALQSTSPISVMYRVRETSVTRIPDQPSYIEGSGPLTLICSGNGNPRPTYTWYKVGNDTALSNTSTLTLMDVTIDISGDYFCTAENVISGTSYTQNVTTSILIGQVPVGDQDSKTNSNDNLAAIIGGSVGAIIAVAIVIGLCKYSMAKKGKYNGENNGQITHFESTVETNNAPPVYNSLQKGN